MNNSKPRILVVDDSAEDISVLVNALMQDFQVIVANNGLKAIELCHLEHRPDLILMDVEMPEMDGFSACQAIKSDSDCDTIEVIFISSLSDLDSKLQGYAVGGADYLTKPIQPAELLTKIRRVLEINTRNRQLQADSREAFNTAMTAMYTASELGIVLEMSRRLFQVDTLEGLAEAILEALGRLDLIACLRIETSAREYFHATQGEVNPLEADLLVQLSRSGRILERGKRLIFNFNGLHLLVKNSPPEDDKRGRYRDIIAIMLESAEARLKVILNDQLLSRLVVDARRALESIDTLRLAHKQQSLDIISDLLARLERSFLAWGLTEEQEEILLSTVRTALEQFQDHVQQGEEIDTRMREILDRVLLLPH